MGQYIIHGGRKLCGSVKLKAAKNSVLPLIAASVLTDEKVFLINCPIISDVTNMIKILNYINADAKVYGDTIELDCSNLISADITREYSQALRSSIFLLGSVLSRLGKATFSYPGGCNIGKRPIDIHISGLKQLGVNIIETETEVVCDASNMKSGNVYLKFPSVGATENLIMASVLLKGTTTLYNVATEPEIADLCNMLIKMGADIKGVGKPVIVINGVKRLKGVSFQPISDRIVLGTFIAAHYICGGELEIVNVDQDSAITLISNFTENPCLYEPKNGKINLRKNCDLQLKDCFITKPYPYFATDLQAITMAMALFSAKKTAFVETVFEARFKHIEQMRKLGADIEEIGSVAVVNSHQDLCGSTLAATDLRAGAALTLCALGIDDDSIINNVEQIERGYHEFDSTLRSIGANIIKQ